MERILLSPPHMNGEEKAQLREAFESSWVTYWGSKVEQFEQEVRCYLGAPHSIAVHSGTAAIHLGLKALGVGAGDYVFCSDVTFSGSCNPILYEKATPVFIDSDESWNMSPTALEQALRTYAAKGILPKAVIVVDLYGLPAKYSELSALCAEYGVPILEDAAEALGSVYRDKKCGTFGTIGILSFNTNKMVTCTGGGMVFAEDAAYIEKIRFWANQSKEPVPFYQHKEVGYNYRMSSLLAAIGLGQMRTVDEFVKKRREINRCYREQLSGLPLTFPHEIEGAFSNYWLSVVCIDSRSGVAPADVLQALDTAGIEGRNFWNPMHRQPVFADCDFFTDSPGLPVGSDLFARGLCLPSGVGLCPGDLDRVVSVIRKCFL